MREDEHGYLGRIRLKGGPLDGQTRTVRFYIDRPPPPVVRFTELLPFPEIPARPQPMGATVRAHAYRSVRWMKDGHAWYEWEYDPEI